MIFTVTLTDLNVECRSANHRIWIRLKLLCFASNTYFFLCGHEFGPYSECNMQSINVLEISTTKNTDEIMLMLTLMRSYFLLGYLDKSPRVPEA